VTVREPIDPDTVNEALDRLALFLTLNSRNEDPQSASSAFAELLGLTGPGMHALAERLEQFAHAELLPTCMLGVVMGLLIAEHERWETA